MLAVMLTIATLAPPRAEDADVVLGEERSVGGQPGWVKPHVELGAGFRRDLTFRPWSPSYILKRGEWGTLSLLGTTFGGCLDRASRMPCEDRAEAGVSLAWTPRNSIVSFFGGLNMESAQHAMASRASMGVTFVGGLLITPPALVDLLRPRAARSRK